MSSSDSIPSDSNDQAGWRSFQKEITLESVVEQSWRGYAKDANKLIESQDSWRTLQVKNDEEQAQNIEHMESWRTQQLKPVEQKAREDERKERMQKKSEKRAQKREKAKQEWAKHQATLRKNSQLPKHQSITNTNQSYHKPITQSPAQSSKKQKTDQKHGKKHGKKRRYKPIDANWLKQAGLRYLGRFAASEKHFRHILKQKIRNADARVSDSSEDHQIWIDQAVDYAKKYAGLDDERIAKNLFRSWSNKGLSERVIRQKMKQKGIASDLVNTLYAERDSLMSTQDAQLYAVTLTAYKHKLGPWSRKKLDIKIKQKQLAKLARRGFSYSLSKTILDADLSQAELWLEQARESKLN